MMGQVMLGLSLILVILLAFTSIWQDPLAILSLPREGVSLPALGLGMVSLVGLFTRLVWGLLAGWTRQEVMVFDLEDLSALAFLAEAWGEGLEADLPDLPEGPVADWPALMAGQTRAYQWAEPPEVDAWLPYMEWGE